MNKLCVILLFLTGCTHPYASEVAQHWISAQGVRVSSIFCATQKVNTLTPCSISWVVPGGMINTQTILCDETTCTAMNKSNGP